jgi:hypothetical protein
VYSRAMTSEMAERWPVFFLASDLPEVEGLSFGILVVVGMGDVSCQETNVSSE